MANCKLTKPCDQCPFTFQPKAVKLRRGRVEELANLLDSDNFSFHCHKTAYSNQPERDRQYCPGSMVLHMRHLGYPNQMMRIAHRLRLLDLDKLDGSQVYEDVDDFLDGAVLPGE